MYTYLLLRQDLSPEQSIIQASHAALEAGIRFGSTADISNLVLLAVPDQQALQQFQ